jgi:hypothetical protein
MSTILPASTGFYKDSFTFFFFFLHSQVSAVGIATSYGPDDRGVRVLFPVDPRIFSFPCRPDRLLGPANLLPNGYRGSFSGGKASGAYS